MRRVGGRVRRAQLGASRARQQHTAPPPVQATTFDTAPENNAAQMAKLAQQIKEFQANQGTQATRLDGLETQAQSAQDTIARINAARQQASAVRLNQTMPGQTVGSSGGGRTSNELRTLMNATAPATPAAPYRPTVQFEQPQSMAAPATPARIGPTNNPRSAAARLGAVNAVKYGAGEVAVGGALGAGQAAIAGGSRRQVARAGLSAAKNAAYGATAGWALGALGGLAGGALGGPVGATAGATAGGLAGRIAGPVAGNQLERGIHYIAHPSHRAGAKQAPKLRPRPTPAPQRLKPGEPTQTQKQGQRPIPVVKVKLGRPDPEEGGGEEQATEQAPEPEVIAPSAGKGQPTRQGNMGPQGGFISRVYQGNLAAFDDLAPSGAPYTAKRRSVSTLAPLPHKMARGVGRYAVDPNSGLPMAGVRARNVSRALRLPAPSRSAQLVY